jgi:hypothetical protein
MPAPELQEAFDGHALVSGGCEVLGYDLDPPYACLACGFREKRFDPTCDEYPPQVEHGARQAERP